MNEKRLTITRTLLGWFCLTLCICSIGQTANAQNLMTPEQMQQDLGYVADLLRRVHPEPFPTLPGDEFETLVARLGDQITNPLPRDEFFFVLRELTNSFKESHTSIQNTQEQSYLPVRFYWATDGLVVSQVEGTSGLEVGDKIIRIGGNDSLDLIEQMAPLIPADNVYGMRCAAAAALSMGSFLHHLHLAENETVRFIAEDAAGHLKDVRVILILSPPPAPTASRPFFGWQIDADHSLGLFYLDQCIFNTAYQTGLKDFFREVHNRQIKFVAFDVRTNPGGDSRVSDELLRYLPVSLEASAANNYLTSVLGFLTDIRFSPEAAAQRGYPYTTGYYWADLGLRLTGRNVIRILPPDSPDLIFRGQLFILTTGYTASSANFLATIFQDNHLALIVGEPTGGKPSHYGDVLRFVLPNSRFGFILSHKKFYRPDYTKDSLDSIFPDLHLPTQVDDIRQGRDQQLSGLLQLLSGLPPERTQSQRSGRREPGRSRRSTY